MPSRYTTVYYAIPHYFWVSASFDLNILQSMDNIK